MRWPDRSGSGSARGGGRIVGTSALGCSVGDNLHLADLSTADTGWVWR